MTVHDELRAALERAIGAEERLAAALEALKPLALLAQFVNEKHRDSRPMIYGLENVQAEILTIGDLRRARQIIEAQS